MQSASMPHGILQFIRKSQKLSCEIFEGKLISEFHIINTNLNKCIINTNLLFFICTSEPTCTIKSGMFYLFYFK